MLGTRTPFPVDVPSIAVTALEDNMTIRLVTIKDHGKIEGKTSDIPWLMAEQCFISFFSDKQKAAGLCGTVKEKHGLSTDNAKDWVMAMNSIINILNNLPKNANEATVRSAFGV